MKLVNKTMEVDESTLQPQLVVTVSLPLETEFDEAVVRNDTMIFSIV